MKSWACIFPFSQSSWSFWTYVFGDATHSLFVWVILPFLKMIGTAIQYVLHIPYSLRGNIRRTSLAQCLLYTHIFELIASIKSPELTDNCVLSIASSRWLTTETRFCVSAKVISPLNWWWPHSKDNTWQNRSWSSCTLCFMEPMRTQMERKQFW